MKKIFVCFLLTAFALALAACGQKEATAQAEPAPAGMAGRRTSVSRIS